MHHPPASADAPAGASWLGTVLESRYAFPHLDREIVRVTEGTETDNFRVTIGRESRRPRRLFAKVYRPGADLDRQAAVLDLSEQARRARIPMPAVVPDRDGRLLIPEGDRAVVLSAFSGGSTTSEPWTREQAFAVGRVLGRLHLVLVELPDTGAFPTPCPAPAPSTRRYATPHRPLWWTKPASTTLESVAEVVQRIEALRAAGYAKPGDLARLAQLRERAEAIRWHRDALVAGLPALHTQLVHGDFCRPNVLLAPSKPQVAAVIDPRYRHLPPAWELGRVAFDPLNVAGGTIEEWLATALATVRGYRSANAQMPPEQITGCARMALLHTLLSTYPVWERYIAPVPLVQEQLDRYWDDRCAMARKVLANLDRVEDELDRTAHSPAPSRGRLRGRR